MESKRSIYALGIGHNTLECLDLAVDCGYHVEGLFHYDGSRTHEVVQGYTILGSFDDLFKSGLVKGNSFVLTMGDNQIRASLCEQITEQGGFLPTLIHPKANVSRFAVLSPKGVQVYPYVNIMSDTRIGDDTIILSHAIIAHTTKVGNHCLVSLRATIGAYTVVEDFVDMGMGALSISGKVETIGHHALIGASSLLTRAVEPYAIMVGSPAREMGKTIPPQT